MPRGKILLVAMVVAACGTDPTTTFEDGNSTGGILATGGTPTSGGLAAPGGGTETTGGMGMTGGGGNPPAGGVMATGGVLATGGTRQTGGSDRTGGATATGGVLATGGSVGVGATGGSGASSPTGGSGGTGGFDAVGGVATGGAGTGGIVDDTPVGRHGQLRVEGNQLVDQGGAAVQLKGASSMWLNWEDRGYAESLPALEWMRDNWNLQVFRAAMGIEPQFAYLDDPETARGQVETIVQNAITAGVYVIIDWHDHNAHEHRAQAQSFFADMAQTYGDAPNVIYEVYNEPENVEWSSTVKPYHEALVATIREHDPDNLIVLGTPQWCQLVDDAANDPVAGTNLLYTLHFYSCSHTGWLRDAGDQARAAGIALFVTEWGASDADGGLDGITCLEEAQTWHDWMNANSISWTAWKLDGCQDSTCYFASDDAPLEGGWTDEWLLGHAPFVRDRMRE